MKKQLTYLIDRRNWLRAKNAEKLETLLRRARACAFDCDNGEIIQRLKTAMLKRRAILRANACPANWKQYTV